MISKENSFFLAKVFKTHGINGSVFVKFDADDTQQYNELESVFLEINKKLIPFFIEDIRVVSEDNAIIKFWDVNSEQDALEIIGAALYLPDSFLPQLLDNKDYYFHELKGLRVVDIKRGDIGIAVDVIEYPHHKVLEVDKDGTEILIPISDEIILSIERKDNKLNVNCPEGLLEVYL
jgi:16S rRNA processing protein RimM